MVQFQNLPLGGAGTPNAEVEPEPQELALAGIPGTAPLGPRVCWEQSERVGRFLPLLLPGLTPAAICSYGPELPKHSPKVIP